MIAILNESANSAPKANKKKTKKCKHRKQKETLPHPTMGNGISM
jgi:hypothetical protein